MSPEGYSVENHRTEVLCYYLQDKLRGTNVVELVEKQKWFLRCIKQDISGIDT